MKKLLTLLALMAGVIVGQAEDIDSLHLFVEGASAFDQEPHSYIQARLINTNHSAFENLGLASVGSVVASPLVRTVPLPSPAPVVLPLTGWAIMSALEANEPPPYIDVHDARKIAIRTDWYYITNSYSMKTKTVGEYLRSPYYKRYREYVSYFGGLIPEYCTYDSGWKEGHLIMGLDRSYWDYRGRYQTSYSRMPYGDFNEYERVDFSADMSVKYHLYKPVFGTMAKEVAVIFSGHHWPIPSDREYSIPGDQSMTEHKVTRATLSIDGTNVTPKWIPNWDLYYYGVGPATLQCSF